MGSGIFTQHPVQCSPVGRQQIDLEAGAVLHGDNLPAFIAEEALLTGKPLQKAGFFHYALGKLLEIFQCIGCTAESTGQQQSVQFGLRCGDGNDLDNVLLGCLDIHGGAAAHTVMTADSIAHDKAVQQGRDQFRLGHIRRLLLHILWYIIK